MSVPYWVIPQQPMPPELLDFTSLTGNKVYYRRCTDPSSETAREDWQRNIDRTWDIAHGNPIGISPHTIYVYGSSPEPYLDPYLDPP